MATQEDFDFERFKKEAIAGAKSPKLRGAFSFEQALMKLMYLVIKNISKKRTMPIHNWGLAFSQLYIKLVTEFFRRTEV